MVGEFLVNNRQDLKVVVLWEHDTNHETQHETKLKKSSIKELFWDVTREDFSSHYSEL